MKKREFSSQYLAKCQRKLQEWNAPLDDWDCMCVSDTNDDGASAYDSTCELCGCKNVRFIHEMYHEDYFERVYVGCICAGIMEGDIIAARERERQVKNRSKRKANFMKREWKAERNGCYKLVYKTKLLRIIPTRGGILEVLVDGRSISTHKGKEIKNFLTAVHAAFDLIDPPNWG